MSVGVGRWAALAQAPEDLFGQVLPWLIMLIGVVVLVGRRSIGPATVSIDYQCLIQRQDILMQSSIQIKPASRDKRTRTIDEYRLITADGTGRTPGRHTTDSHITRGRQSTLIQI